MIKIVLFKISAIILIITATITLLIATNSIEFLGFWDSEVTIAGVIAIIIAIGLILKVLNKTEKIN